MTCGSAIYAPWNDLQLLQPLIRYESVSMDISKCAVKAFSRHLWYLTAEMVPLALFSTKVPPDQLQSLASSLLAVKPTAGGCQPEARFGTGFGKPAFPKGITMDTTLADLVGDDSWAQIGLLKLDCSFLDKAVATWSEFPAYKSSAATVKSLNVVNNCAERGVKLSTDFWVKQEQSFTIRLCSK